jgi:hypothetical protein
MEAMRRLQRIKRWIFTGFVVAVLTSLVIRDELNQLATIDSEYQQRLQQKDNIKAPPSRPAAVVATFPSPAVAPLDTDEINDRIPSDIPEFWRENLDWSHLSRCKDCDNSWWCPAVPFTWQGRSDGPGRLHHLSIQV